MHVTACTCWRRRRMQPDKRTNKKKTDSMLHEEDATKKNGAGCLLAIFSNVCPYIRVYVFMSHISLLIAFGTKQQLLNNDRYDSYRPFLV